MELLHATGADLAEREAVLALTGHSGDPALARSLMADHAGRTFVLTRLPLAALDFQYDPSGRFHTDSDHALAGAARQARTAAYAALATPAPPIVVLFGAAGLRRALARGQRPLIYVKSGNHRAGAAALRGETEIDAWIPADDYERWLSTQGATMTNPPEIDFADAPGLNAQLDANVRATLNAEHLAKFMVAMHPDPREWLVEEEIGDGGPDSKERCTCGHPIRYVHSLKRERDGKKIKVGSVCIEGTVPYLMSVGAEHLAAQLLESLERLREHQRRILSEGEKRKRAAKGDAMVAALSVDWASLQGWTKALLDGYYEAARRSGSYRPLPEYLYWSALRTFPNEKPKALSSAGRTATSMRTKLLQLFVSAHRLPEAGSAPIPTEGKLLDEFRAWAAKQTAEHMEIAQLAAAGTLPPHRVQPSHLDVNGVRWAMQKLGGVR